MPTLAQVQDAHAFIKKAGSLLTKLEKLDFNYYDNAAKVPSSYPAIRDALVRFLAEPTVKFKKEGEHADVDPNTTDKWIEALIPDLDSDIDENKYKNAVFLKEMISHLGKDNFKRLLNNENFKADGGELSPAEKKLTHNLNAGNMKFIQSQLTLLMGFVSDQLKTQFDLPYDPETLAFKPRDTGSYEYSFSDQLKEYKKQLVLINRDLKFYIDYHRKPRYEGRVGKAKLAFDYYGVKVATGMLVLGLLLALGSSVIDNFLPGFPVLKFAVAVSAAILTPVGLGSLLGTLFSKGPSRAYAYKALPAEYIKALPTHDLRVQPIHPAPVRPPAEDKPSRLRYLGLCFPTTYMDINKRSTARANTNQNESNGSTPSTSNNSDTPLVVMKQSVN